MEDVDEDDDDGVNYIGERRGGDGVHLSPGWSCVTRRIEAKLIGEQNVIPGGGEGVSASPCAVQRCLKRACD